MIESSTTFADPRFVEFAPVYRVNFWAPAPGGGWGLEAVVLRGASSVSEVLDWVADLRGARKVEVFVEVDSEHTTGSDVPRRSGLIRILGENPDEGVTVALGSFIPRETDGLNEPRPTS